MERFIPRQRAQEITQCRDEGVLVTNDVARLPEVLGIGMIGAGYQQIADALEISGLGRIKDFQIVQIL